MFWPLTSCSQDCQFFGVTQSLLMVLLVFIACKRSGVPYHFYREISQQSI